MNQMFTVIGALVLLGIASLGINAMLAEKIYNDLVTKRTIEIMA